ncbi:MAG: protein-L-isoaspartate(D-aspartate) O-methyltransferase [Nitrospinota bacterium]|nr:protein-L-isoaspartate(D-aspartate) O-methyltransferase [Nitrospinota bacterium]
MNLFKDSPMNSEKRWEIARLEMIEKQIIGRGIKDKKVINVMSKVPRHYFCPEVFKEDSYADKSIPIGHGQTISQPYMVAVSLESLSLKGNEKILEIGSGSGYVTALLCEMGLTVRSIERISELSDTARKKLEELGYSNFLLWTADGTYGWSEEAPFDVILSAASGVRPPQPWLEQLTETGNLIMPIGDEKKQILTKVISDKNGTFKVEEVVGCVFVKLIGRHGWKS